MVLVPSSYPGRAVVYVITHADILKLVLRYFLTEIFPAYWIFRSWTEDHHRRLFWKVLQARGVDPLTVAKLTSEEERELKVVTQIHSAKLQVKKSRVEENPVVEFGVWLFTPPSKETGRLGYFLHRLLIIPVKAVFPFLPVLFGALKAPALTVEALSPYFELKGITSTGQQHAIAQSHRWSFRQFGGAALVLQSIPILTLFLQFVNTVAAAMWAADLEKGGHSLITREDPPSDVHRKDIKDIDD